MLLIYGWYGHLTEVKDKFHFSSTVSLIKIAFDQGSITSNVAGAALTFTVSTSKTLAKWGRANMRHATVTSCHLKERREKNVHSQVVGEGRWLFRKRSSNLHIMSQREVSDRLPVISAVPGEEKHTGSFGKVYCHHSQYNCHKNCEKEDIQRTNPAACSIIESRHIEN